MTNGAQSTQIDRALWKQCEETRITLYNIVLRTGKEAYEKYLFGGGLRASKREGPR